MVEIILEEGASSKELFVITQSMIRLFSFFSAILAASMILSACIDTATIPAVCKTDPIGCAVYSSGQTIKIGLGAPMTGENAAIGQDISQAARLAVSDAVHIHGFSFELDTEDDGSTPTGAAEVANQFAGDPQIIAAIGHIFSGATQAAIPIYEAAGIPMMSPSATADTLTENGAKVFNRLEIPDGKQGRFAADRLFHFLKVTNLAVLYDSSTDGQGIAQAVNDSFKALGGNVVVFQAISPGESDYSAEMAGVASKKPDALFYGGTTSEAVVLVNELAGAGLQNVIFFSDEGILNQNFLGSVSTDNAGIYASSSQRPPGSDAKTKFDAAYLAAYGQASGSLSAYTWKGYDSAAILIKAVENVSKLGSGGKLYVPRAALIAAVRTTKNYQGLSGIVTCDTTGECSDSNPILNQVKAGTWEVIP